VITAATTQQGVGRALIAIALVGLLIYVIAENRASKARALTAG
jgi:hypothetical protein